MTTTAPSEPYPLGLEGRLDAGLSRWLWLVKWLMAIPHFVVLAFLWLGFVAATAMAFVAILVTGRYPRGLFDYGVGVLRWSWRVGHYSWSALGTDRYPPFTLEDVPDYPARLDVAYPDHLSRGLVLVKWLLAIPHLVVVGLLLGGGIWVAGRDDPWFGTGSTGLIGILVLVAAVVLLFTGRYPGALYDLVLGFNRWVYRVAAYVALMTDVYPPFRLDLGGQDPGRPAALGPSPAPGGAGPHRTPPGREASWSGGRVTMLVVGAVLALSSLALLGAGGAALWADQTQRDAEGYVSTGTTTLSTSASALVAEPLEVTLDRPGDAFWIREALGTVEVAVQAPAGRELFVGLARSDDVDRFLRGAAVDRVVEVTSAGEVVYDRRSGGTAPAPPADQGFWAASASGSGDLALEWEVEGGVWTVVVMNADASPGLAADVRVGATVPALTGIAAGLLAAGAALLAVGMVLLVIGAAGARPGPPGGPHVPTPRSPMASPAPPTGAPVRPGPLRAPGLDT